MDCWLQAFSKHQNRERGLTFEPLSGKTKALLFPKRQILDSSKLKEFADDNFEFDENGGKSYPKG